MNTFCSGVTACRQQGALAQGPPQAGHGAAAPLCAAGLPTPLPARRRRSSGLGALQAAWAAPARASASRRARLGVSAVASPVSDIEGLKLAGLSGDELKEADLKNLRSVSASCWRPHFAWRLALGARMAPAAAAAGGAPLCPLAASGAFCSPGCAVGAPPVRAGFRFRCLEASPQLGPLLAAHVGGCCTPARPPAPTAPLQARSCAAPRRARRCHQSPGRQAYGLVPCPQIGPCPPCPHLQSLPTSRTFHWVGEPLAFVMTVATAVAVYHSCADVSRCCRSNLRSKLWSNLGQPCARAGRLHLRSRCCCCCPDPRPWLASPTHRHYHHHHASTAPQSTPTPASHHPAGRPPARGAA